ncbi:hypothetical protein ACP70R_030985 [Stipagrostis hirtigluma subsp. patula]
MRVAAGGGAAVADYLPDGSGIPRSAEPLPLPRRGLRPTRLAALWRAPLTRALDE